MSSLELVNIKKRYGDLDILKGIDISVEAGEFLVLVGPSGCGKSTLLNIIAGLDTATGGDVRIGGRSVRDDHPSERDIAMVFQSYALYPNMSVAQNISFGMEMRKVPKEERDLAIQEVAKLLQIQHLLARRPGQLSGGQRQRVGIARIIYHDREVLVLDEATSALDNATELLVSDAVKTLGGHKTLIIIAHRLSTIEHCDRIYMMERGRVVKSGTYEEVVLGTSPGIPINAESRAS